MFCSVFVVAMISVVGKKLEACISLRIEKRHQCFWKNFFYFSFTHEKYNVFERRPHKRILFFGLLT